MIQHLRVVFKGHFGVPSLPPASFNYTATAAWDKCKALTDGIKGLRLYGKNGNNGSETQPAIGLDYYVTYDDVRNVIGQWSTASIGDATWFEELPSPFRSDAPGLHYLYSGDAGARFESVFDIAANEAFALRSYLFKPYKNGDKHLVAWQWGAAGVGYRLEIIDGRMQLCELSAAWTQGAQNTLDALREAGGTVTQITQESINTQSAALYTKVTAVDVGIDAEAMYNRALEIVIIPEPRGRVHIIVSGAGEVTVDCERVQDTGTAGTLWSAGALTYSTNRGETFWQIGDVHFIAVGTLLFPAVRWLYYDPETLLPLPIASMGFTHNGQIDESPAGTDIDFDFAGSGAYPRYQVTFTGDGNRTPFLYSTATFATGGERNGDDAVFLDTDEIEDGNLISRFIPSCEGEKRRFKIELTLDKPGEFLQLVHGGLELHNRMADFYLDDVLYVGNMIVQDVGLSPVARAHASVTTDTPAPADYAPVLSGTQGIPSVDLTFVDLETLADEDIMRDDPILDGMDLGVALRTVWQGMGLTAYEVSAIPTDTGIILDSARLGESPAVRPSRDTPRGDFSDWLMQEYAINYDLDTFSGYASLVNASAQPVFELDEDLVEDLELTRDYRDTFNIMPFEGLGERVEVWSVSESWNDPDWRGYMGRQKRAATVSNNGRRTQGSVSLAARQNARQKGKPGNFASFKYPFIKNLLPRRRFRLSGVLYTVERIEPDDQAKVEMMRIVGREYIRVF